MYKRYQNSRENLQYIKVKHDFLNENFAQIEIGAVVKQTITKTTLLINK